MTAEFFLPVYAMYHSDFVNNHDPGWGGEAAGQTLVRESVETRNSPYRFQMTASFIGKHSTLSFLRGRTGKKKVAVSRRS
jgi:hypothetical protein